MARFKAGDRVRVVEEKELYGRTGTIAIVPVNPEIDQIAKTSPGIEQYRVYWVRMDDGSLQLLNGMNMELE